MQFLRFEPERRYNNKAMNESGRRHPRLDSAVSLLRDLIAEPSPSREEAGTADIWEKWLNRHGLSNVGRFHNNVYCVHPDFREGRQTLMLNSHHDTVKPVKSYTRDPYSATIEGDRLYGLGSNDAGGSGVALASAFLELYELHELPVNLIFAITAAEEVMGEYGMRAFLPHLREKGLYPDMAIIGEPTNLEPAVAERGLIVLDCVTRGVSGHAGRGEGINALYRAIEDIEIIRNFEAPETSGILGKIRTNITMIEAGTQHNVVPDECRFVADIRTTDTYSNEETARMLQSAVKWSELTPRSTRVRASVISESHPLVESAKSLGKTPFVSQTTSDMALMPDIATLKIGPGDSKRSHGADEYILISEINEALYFYPELIKNINI